MKVFAILVTVLSLTNAIFSQNSFGLKLAIGQSKFEQSLQVWGGLEPNIYPKVSGQFGLWGDRELSSMSHIGTEATFSLIQSKDEFFNIFTDINGQVISEDVTNVNRMAIYLAVPLYYSLQLNKFSLNAGFQVSLLLYSLGKESGNYPTGGGGSILIEKKEKLAIDIYDFGPRFGALYSISDKFSIELMYYHGMNNILENNPSFWDMSVRQAVFGVRYGLSSSE